MENLYNCNKETYGECHDEHLFKQYKLFIEMADRTSQRRQNVNSFFLTINTVLISFIGYENIVFLNNDNLYDFITILPQLLIAISGIILCYSWMYLINSYKQLNSAKFKIINDIEKHLPLKLYTTEWSLLKKTNYLGLNKFEKIVPFIFNLLYLVYICILVYIRTNNICCSILLGALFLIINLIHFKKIN